MGGPKASEDEAQVIWQAPCLMDPGRVLKIWAGCLMGASKAWAQIDPRRGQPWRAPTPTSKMY
eukprot:5754284-Pyramimonas_sp.AAC.1